MFLKVVKNHLKREKKTQIKFSFFILPSSPGYPQDPDPDPHEDFCPDPDPQKKCGSETLHIIYNFPYMYFIYLCVYLSRSDFSEWEWLDNCMHKMSQHPSVSNKMKLRY